MNKCALALGLIFNISAFIILKKCQIRRVMSLIEAMFKVEEGPSVHLLVIVYSVDYRLNIYSLALSLSYTHTRILSPVNYRS